MGLVFFTDPWTRRRRFGRLLRWTTIWWIVVLLSLLSALWTPASAAEPALPDDGHRLGAALQRASDASIGLLVQAVEGAASAETLGAQRKGSGVVIGEDGLVLTIGYLILEAEQIDLVLDDGRRIPARPLAHDLATGFGLVQALLPLPMSAVPLGEAAALVGDETLLMVSGGHGGMVGPTRLVARGQFAGYWEYLIDGALFTAPARTDHSGAGLYNRRGELVGVGSMVLADTRSSLRQPADWLGAEVEGGRLPGNLFVPIDLFKPIVDELRRSGRSAASRRAWLGVNCTETEGRILVMRVSRDSPAEAAGLRPGDHILGLDGLGVGDLPAFYRRLWQGGPAERDVHLQVVRDGEVHTLMLHAVDQQSVIRRASGI